MRGLVSAVLVGVLKFVSGGPNEELLPLVAFHRVCCVPENPSFGFPHHRTLTANSGGLPDPVTDWTAILSQLQSGSCIHSYGFGRAAVADFVSPATTTSTTPKTRTTSRTTSSRESFTSDSLDLSLVGGINSKGINFDHESSFQGQYVKGVRFLETRRASCGTIELFVPPAAERRLMPDENLIEFFTPKFLDELTEWHPHVRLQTGSGEVNVASDDVEWTSSESRTYKYRETFSLGGQGIEESQRDEVVTREALATDLQRWLVSSTGEQISGFIQFLEFATDSRVATLGEVRELNFEQQLTRLMTFEKLKSVDIAEQVEFLRRKLGNQEDEQWIRRVPTEALRRDSGDGSVNSHHHHRRKSHHRHHHRGQPDGSQAGSRSYSLAVKGRLRNGSPLRGTKTRRNSGDRTVDLSLLAFKKDTQRLVDYLTETQELDKHISDTSGRIRRAFWSNSIPIFLPSSENSHGGEDVSRVISSGRITSFMLVNGPLAVSGAKYAEVLGAAIHETLTEREMPFFSVCSPRIDMMSKGSLIDAEFEFTAEAPRRAKYSYGTLADVDSGDLVASECIIIGLMMDVPESKYKTLTRQPLDVVFALISRGHGAWHYETKSCGVPRDKVDLWSVLRGEDSQLIEDMFNKAGKEIEYRGFWPPELLARIESSRQKIRSSLNKLARA